MEALQLREQLRSHLAQIVRERDPYLATEGHFYVQQYLREQLGQWGDVISHEFTAEQRPHVNLILNLPARDFSNRPPIVIGAHYDAVPGTPGADDNASGVAVMLELARAIAATPARYPLRFVAFDLEEYGMVGSDRYAAQLHQQGQRLRLMLSLEMVGYCTQAPDSQHYPNESLKAIYPSVGNFIALIGNAPTQPDLIHLSQHLQAVAVPCQWLPAGMHGEILQETRLSDHAPFWDRGYQAIMVTDTSFMRNPHYHQRSDRLETLDLDFMTGVCRGLIHGIQNL